MFHEKYLSKLIIFTPIILIILVTTLVTFTQIKKLESKFIEDSTKLKAKLIKEEKNKLSQKINTLDEYITYQKSTTKKLLNTEIKQRVDLIYEIILNKYNENTGIEKEKKIKKDLIDIIKVMEFKDNGYFFLIEKKNNKLIPIIYPAYREYENKDILKIENKEQMEFVKQIKNMTKDKYITYNLKTAISNIDSYKKISFIKIFKPYNWLIGHGNYFEIIDTILKQKVLNRIDSFDPKSDQKIFVIDKNNVILNTNYKKITDNSDNEFIKKINKTRKEKNYNKTYYFWTKSYKNLIAYKYVKDWDWVLVDKIDLKSLEKTIIDIIGNKKQDEKNLIQFSIKIALFVILFGSLLTFFISKRIELIFKSYKNNIESQKNVLKNINATLESKVKYKTKELEKLNEQLKDEVKKEVLKNRKKDQMLFNQSKMASMGEMIGNIAHQWRQPLSTISTAASGIAIKYDYGMLSKEEVKKDLKAIVNTTQYLSQTIEDFRNFFKENKEKEGFLLDDCIDDSLKILDAAFKNNYIEVIREKNNIKVYSIKSELTQAILNILTNAKDILTQDAKIEDDKRFIKISITNDEKFAYIVICDSGGGIKKDIINKVFEPYFTTKHQSQGTGIGLYMTREIIIKHLNGNILVENKEFEHQNNSYFGASFKIIIPVDSLS
ncbi:cache domain-containing protein [Arcobacter sp. CECT 8985]|uniref:sensor histidine kinase n=1 Tax=Arcobacter sp. CECT 8985 TaxID=1935424 RepID=UPI00100C0177|nr:cache domain-containing protein [Arcobacter sp. CECT 8985]RXJ87943.1 hypothetical protein CRU93_02055 [Arcobacter sp. CECT 8985]